MIRTRERFGINHVSAVLRGGNTKGIRQWEHSNLSVYGIAKDLSSAEIKEIFGLLVAEGLLKKNSGDLPTFGVTEAGRRFLRKRETLTLARPERAEEKASTASRAKLDYDQTLFDGLRELRSRLAAERKVPPYIIFGDGTLQEMAYYLPQSRESLARIKGVGAVKLEQLGDTFLSVICAHARPHKLQAPTTPAYNIDELNQDYPRAYRRWSSAEDERLRILYSSRKKISEMARLLGRQRGSIRLRLRKLGLDKATPRGSTYEQTIQMFRQGMTIEEVAQKRGPH